MSVLERCPRWCRVRHPCRLRYLTSCQGRFALVSKSAKQSNRRLLCYITNGGVGIQVLDSTEGLLVKLSAVLGSLQKLEKVKGCWNFWYCPRVWLIPWKLGKCCIRIVRNNPSGSPGTFNITCGVGRCLCRTVESPESSLGYTGTGFLHVCSYCISICFL